MLLGFNFDYSHLTDNHQQVICFIKLFFVVLNVNRIDVYVKLRHLY